MSKLRITPGEWGLSYTTEGKIIVVSPWNKTTVKVENTPTFQPMKIKSVNVVESEGK